MDKYDVIIEIPKNCNLKYEIDNDENRLRLDRVLPSSMIYPYNYGYIPNTLAEDGDALDVLVLTPYKIRSNTIVKCKIIGALIMSDEKGLDEKVIAVPDDKVDPQFKDINNLNHVSQVNLDNITHFFNYYKKNDDEKWSKVDRYIDKEETLLLIEKYSISS
jgi:inorganic pyrophosphatase